MSQFICVRVVQTNAMDLELFQFDYDLTFAALFLNADRTIYGRYGSRSNEESTDDISIEGFREALSGALELHRGFPANKGLLAGKQSRPVRFKRPEEYPSLRGKFNEELDYAGNVARSCMHCHQVRDAERLMYRMAKKPIPDQVLYPYPLPDAVGLKLDHNSKARVTTVARGSAAEKAGFRAGDEFVSLDGQPIISIADAQWVLQNAGGSADTREAANSENLLTLGAEVVREGKRTLLTLKLSEGWRRASDISWRVTTWDLRRMGTGGLVLEELPAEERQKAGLSGSDLGLRVKYVGQYGDHAAAKRAGFQKGDILVDLDGQTHRMTESDVLAYAVQEKLPGDKVSVTVLREGKRVGLKLPLQ
ncbi:MAG: PDZ domain-containing protein [Planctomycetes bacterium]|nr:PDZ domain-containing protein [Planctomycetota bacterium]